MSTAEAPGEELSPTPRATAAPRRTRVSLACQRCKHRKQKCNGQQPACARCLRLGLDCHYVMPTTLPKPSQAKLYINALEERVAQLEHLLAKEGDRGVSRDHWPDPTLISAGDSDDDSQADLQPLLNAVRDLSLDVAGSYVGGTSTITLGRALETALAGRTQLSLPQSPNENDIPDNTSIDGNANSLSHMGPLQLDHISREAADMMVYGYLKHLSVNFPIMRSVDIMDLHNRNCELRDVYEFSILNLIYSLGGHFLDTTGESKHAFNPELHYQIALESREAILRLGDTRSLTYLMLLGQHCYRMPKDPGAWAYFGLAMKTCVELGLHRRRTSSKLTIQSELKKRLFWVCYWHEREIAIAMGRPPSVSDHDIDVPLPLDVDEAIQDVNVLRKAAEQDLSLPVYPQTTMTTIIHLLRLKRLESEIQHKIYRVDKTSSSKDICRATDMYIEKLVAWKNAIPPQSNRTNEDVSGSFQGDEYRTYDSYLASYYKTIRILLQPRLYEKIIDERYLNLCAEACRGVCETYKRLHYKMPVAFTSLSLQSVFLAGLTLIYCMWHDSSNSANFRNYNALTDCSIVLYVMAERWPHSKKYRDLFEAVKSCALQAMEEGKQMKDTAVESMRDDVQSSLWSLPMDTGMESVTEDLEHMISDMAGQPVFLWQDSEISFCDTVGNEATFPSLENKDMAFGQQWDSIDFGTWSSSGQTAADGFIEQAV